MLCRSFQSAKDDDCREVRESEGVCHRSKPPSFFSRDDPAAATRSPLTHMKEAAARIKINKLLENSGWRFFANARGPANIQLESSVIVKTEDLDALGEDFEKAGKGFIDFLLLNEKGFPFIVLEAKAENKSPLVGKEQARKYAKSQNCRFVILSNGNLHYFWDLERGNPYIITSFPTPTSVAGYQKTMPNPQTPHRGSRSSDDYIALTQRPNYPSEAGMEERSERAGFIEVNGLRFLRPYQKKAISRLQQTVKKGTTASFSKWPPAPARR